MSVNSKEYSAVAFYGFDVEADAAQRFYEEIIRLFQSHGCPPSRLGVHGDGFSGKLMSFSRTHSRLIKCGFKRVQSVEIHSQLPKDIAPIVDCKMSADLSLKREYAVVVADSSIVPLKSMLTVARTAVAELNPCYGIGFCLEQRLEPSFYAIGLNYGRHDVFSGAEYDEKVLISRWVYGIHQRVWRSGLLRDVYPFNFLTHAQLSRPVAGVAFEKWIDQEVNRGHLSKFEGNVSLWSVDTSLISQIREALQQEGIIFNGHISPSS